MPRLIVQTAGGNQSLKSNVLNIAPGANVTLAVSQAANGDITLTIAAASGSGTPSGTVESEAAFGQSPAAGASSDYSRGDHTHGTPTDPVTAHEAAGDPHLVYLLDTQFDGLSKISVAASAPGTPATGDLWVDTS
jgi:hypothetical protein